MTSATLEIQLAIVALGVIGIAGVVLAMRHNTKYLAALLAAHSRAILAAADTNRQVFAEYVHQPDPRVPARVMVIEDDAASMKMIAAVLTASGYNVRQSESAEAALESMVAAGLPDLIVLDIRLGEKMNGLELARQLRHVGCRMPILAYSASYDRHDVGHGRRVALEAGCNAFLHKGGETEELLKQIARWLALGASAR